MLKELRNLKPTIRTVVFSRGRQEEVTEARSLSTRLGLWEGAWAGETPSDSGQLAAASGPLCFISRKVFRVETSLGSLPVSKENSSCS